MGATDFVVKDLGLADWGRKEIEIAETEMPGALQSGGEWAGPARILCAHMPVVERVGEQLSDLP